MLNMYRNIVIQSSVHYTCKQTRCGEHQMYAPQCPVKIKVKFSQMARFILLKRVKRILKDWS